jgi:Tol biopolymer transport system component
MRFVRLACVGVGLAAVLASVGAGADTAPSRGTVVYWSDAPWPSIWAVRLDGTEPRRILRNRQNAKRPRLSPDRRWVAFDGAPPGKPVLTDFDIQVVRRDGTGRRTLTRTSQWDTDAQWSPNGRWLTFTRTGPDSDWRKAWIWTVRRDGTGLRRVARGQFARPSPDGRRLVLDTPTAGSDGDLFVVDADGSDRRLLLASPELDQPAGWSPDGRRILFTRFNDAFGRDTDVFVMNADGTGKTNSPTAPTSSASPRSPPTGPRSRSAPTATATARST